MNPASIQGFFDRTRERRETVQSLPWYNTAVDIPVEVHDAIIDQLPGDREFLRACSFVCRRWRERCYHHAFASVTLSCMMIKNLTSSLCVDFSHTTIFPCIRRIEMKIPPNHDIPALDSDVFVSFRSLVGKIGKVGNVTELSVQGLDWSLFSRTVLSVLTNLTEVTSLDLGCTVFSGRPELCELMEAFPSVRNVAFRELEFLHAESYYWNSLQSFSPSCSFTLSLRGCGASLKKEVQWNGSTVLTDDARFELTNMSLHLTNTGDTALLLRLLGPYLQELTVADSDTSGDELLSSLDLSPSTGLKKLTIVSPNRVLGLISWVYPILSTVSADMVALRIVFQGSRQFHLDKPYLQHIARILSGPHYKNLECLRLIVVQSAQDVDIGKLVSECSSVLNMWPEGVLKFSFIDPSTHGIGHS